MAKAAWPRLVELCRCQRMNHQVALRRHGLSSVSHAEPQGLWKRHQRASRNRWRRLGRQGNHHAGHRSAAEGIAKTKGIVSPRLWSPPSSSDSPGFSIRPFVCSAPRSSTRSPPSILPAGNIIGGCDRLRCSGACRNPRRTRHARCHEHRRRNPCRRFLVPAWDDALCATDGRWNRHLTNWRAVESSACCGRVSLPGAARIVQHSPATMANLMLETENPC